MNRLRQLRLRLALAGVLALTGAVLSIATAWPLSLLGALFVLTAMGLAAWAAWSAVRRSEREFSSHPSLRSILDNLGDGVAVADRHGRLVELNPEAERILGVGRVDSSPQDWSEVYGLFRPDGVTPFPVDEMPLARAIQGEESRDIEMFVRNPHRRGGLFIRVTATPLLDPEGKPLGGVAIFRDYTDRKWNETVLRESEERFRSIVEATSVALVILDAEGRILEFNPEAERMFARTRADALGRRFVESCFPEEFRQSVTEDLRRAATGEARPDLETPILTGDSRERTVLWRFGRRSDQAGNVEAVIATGHDVTARREATEGRRIRELAAHLQLARETERQYLAREIHDELGQAMTGLKLEVSFLWRQPGVPDAIAERLRELGSQIDEMIGLLRRIAGRLRPPILDERGLIRALEQQVEEFQRRSGIDCRLHIPADPVDFDDSRAIAIYRIVQESLTNIARHSGAKHAVVRLSERGAGLLLEIRDDGRGISAKELDDPRAFGLMGMQERARTIGAEFTIRTESPSGTLVRVEVPR